MKEYKPRTIQEFGCDHCNKRLRSKAKMTFHEVECYLNPNRQCPTCQNTGKVTRTVRNEKDSLNSFKSFLKTGKTLEVRRHEETNDCIPCTKAKETECKNYL